MTDTPPQIPCPACQAPLVLDVDILASGASLACSNPKCDASISIAGESAALLVRTVQDHRNLRGIRT